LSDDAKAYNCLLFRNFHLGIFENENNMGIIRS